MTRHLDFLPKQSVCDSDGGASEHGCRLGLPRSTTARAFLVDARAQGHAVVARSRDYFLGDTDYPAKLAVFLLTETP